MRCSTALSMTLAAALAGCGGDRGDRPDTHPVSGVIKFKGTPVEGANVTFAPVNASDGAAAFGVTGTDGRYELTTFESGDGAVAGDYQVTVKKIDQPAAAQEESDDRTPDTGRRPAAPKNLLPAKYAAAATSGLTAGVTEDGENTFDFDLQE